MRIAFLLLAVTVSLYAQIINSPAPVKEDTVYVALDEGIPWNREHFDPERLVRKHSLDPALNVTYTYSVSFIGGSFGSFAHQSYMAHLAYEFSPNLHLYANLGIWMPIYSNLSFATPMAKEDLKQGRAQVIVPDVSLEYKPSENVRFRVMLVNENDAYKAYGPMHYSYCKYYNCR
ncbi:MAG: hypothetical protein HUK20_10240 [Fibrobacter sp.]|nr:hypothetical protein [Fibrobacter sp.]